MLDIATRYLKASYRKARQDEETRLVQKEAARVRAEIDDLRQQVIGSETQAAAQASAESNRLETLRESFREQFRGAVIDTAIEIATIKNDELRELARATASALYLSNALPELRPFIHQVLGSRGTALILQ